MAWKHGYRILFPVVSFVYTHLMVCACVFQHTLFSMENHAVYVVKNSKSENQTGKRKLAEITNRLWVTAQCHHAALENTPTYLFRLRRGPEVTLHTLSVPRIDNTIGSWYTHTFPLAIIHSVGETGVWTTGTKQMVCCVLVNAERWKTSVLICFGFQVIVTLMQ